MSDSSTDQVPRSGGIVERLERDDVERKRFLKMLGAGGAASFGTFVIAACGSSSKPSGATSSKTARASTSTAANPYGAGDIGILNYALTLEYLEAAFYKKVVAAGLFSGHVGALIAKFGRQEQTHVAALTKAIETAGATPVSEPAFKFPIESASQVAMLAYTVENLGAAAYLGQAPRIESKKVLADALAIHSVEGRHAAVLGTLVKKPLTPDGAFAKPADIPAVLAAVKPFLA